MKLGIVGHEAAKFTAASEARAREAIRRAIAHYAPTHVISGGCHLGGIDIWAAEEARALGIPVIEHLPRVRNWTDGYKPRNLAIAQDSDLVLCIVVDSLPASYRGMRFEGCYHCGTRNGSHVKSGGCWTAWRCRQQRWIIIPQETSHATR